MSEPTVDVLTAVDAAQDAGLPTDTVHCPRCASNRKAQQIVDVPDDPATAPTPYTCLSCGCEFSVPR